MTSSTPFSFNLLASQDKVAVVHDNRVLLMKNPVIQSVNYRMDASRFTQRTMSGEKIYTPPKEIHLTIDLVANEYIEGDYHSMERQLPETVDNMEVEELLYAVNKKLQEEQQ